MSVRSCTRPVITGRKFYLTLGDAHETDNDPTLGMKSGKEILKDSGTLESDQQR